MEDIVKTCCIIVTLLLKYLICLCPEVVGFVFEICGELFAVHIIVVIKVDVSSHEATICRLRGPQVTSQGCAGVIRSALEINTKNKLPQK